MYYKATIVLLVCFTLSACAALPTNYAPPLPGQVVPVAQSTVLYGMRAALSGHAGTAILANGTRYLFVWSYSNGAAAFFGIDAGGVTFSVTDTLRAGGQLANCKSVTELVTSLQSSGWARVAPGAVAPALVQLAGSRLVNMPLMILTLPGAVEDLLDPLGVEVQG